MESLLAYIPIDRRIALAESRCLSERSEGAALFADISGFTPLTDALVRSLGPQRGAEELPRQLNRVYDALIAEVDRYGGSVIGFSGDAITCWFDEDDALRATACALAMQSAMAQFAVVPIPDGTVVALSVKIAVAAGPVRRFVVGDPAVQQIDVLAGETLDRLAGAEHQAQKGEVVVDAHLDPRVLRRLAVETWRDDEAAGHRVAVVRGMHGYVESRPWPLLDGQALPEHVVRPWLLPPVYERLRSGLGEFLTELRPAVALFLRFGGIDYDADPAASEKLDAYVQWVQSILVRTGGYLIQLTVGDKGSYLYAAFGAPIAHDDDAERAVAAALDLRSTPQHLGFVRDVQIGISRGRMRTGAYGGPTARTYGVLGPETNMAARLMQHAPTGEVLVNQTAQREIADLFTWESRPPLTVKGKAEPATVFRLVGKPQRQAVQLQEPTYALPMVGREAELAQAGQRLDDALGGRGQIVAITAEAGMGKSRLVAEIIRRTAERQMIGYGGECQSYGTNNSYLVWEGIWRGFFGLDQNAPLEDQIQLIEAQLHAFDPVLVPRLPLLGMVLNLPIPDNDLTRSLDAKLRKASLEALLVDCVRARSKTTPLLLVLEDCHWIDPLSHDLLEAIGRAITDRPVLIVAAYRPPDAERLEAPRVEQLHHTTVIPLKDFTTEEAARLIALKIAQLTGSDGTAPPALVERISERAQGNPFYIEELINYLRDRGLDPRDTAVVAQLDLPTSLHSLILSRIDQLTESQKLTLKVASIIGRLFRLSWLWGVHPQLGEQPRVKADLEALSRIDLTPLDQPEPEFTYLFKHIVTREVAYESLPFATREVLHGQLGQFIENIYADSLDQHVDLLAHHYDHSQNLSKRCEYLRKAGEAAQAAYANAAAIDYYLRLLRLLSDEQNDTIHQRQLIHINLGIVLTYTSQYELALEHLHQALQLGTLTGNSDARAQACRWIARVYENRAEYSRAADAIQQGLAALADREVSLRAELLAIAGLIHTRQGNNSEALALGRESLRIAELVADTSVLAFAHQLLGHIIVNGGNSTAAIQHFQICLALYEDVSNIHGQALSHNNIANAHFLTGKFTAADHHYRCARDIFEQVGDVYHVAIADNNLGEIARYQGRLDDALHFYRDGLRSVEQVGGSLYVLGVFHMNLGATFVRNGDVEGAQTHLRLSQEYFVRAQARDFLPELHRHRAEAALLNNDLATAESHANEALQLARELSVRSEEGNILRVLGEIATADGRLEQAVTYLSQSLELLEEMGDEYGLGRSLLSLASAHLATHQYQSVRDALPRATAIFERLDAKLDLAIASGIYARLAPAT